MVANIWDYTGGFRKLNCPFRKKRLISQLGGDLETSFITWRWFCNLVHNLEMISHLGWQLGDDFAPWFAAWRWFCNMVSQLRRWNFNLRSGTRVLPGGFAAAKHLAKFSQADFAAPKFSLNLVRLSSNGHNFFVSAPIRTLFEALDSWLLELKNNI